MQTSPPCSHLPDRNSAPLNTSPHSALWAPKPLFYFCVSVNLTTPGASRQQSLVGLAYVIQHQALKVHPRSSLCLNVPPFVRLNDICLYGCSIFCLSVHPPWTLGFVSTVIFWRHILLYPPRQQLISAGRGARLSITFSNTPPATAAHKSAMVNRDRSDRPYKLLAVFKQAETVKKN